MLIAESIHTCNIYSVDLTEKTVELWNNYGEWRLLRTEVKSDAELAQFMFDAMKYGWVQRDSEAVARVA